MTLITASLTDAQVKLAQMLVVGSALGFFVTLLILRFWVWAIVGWVVSDLRRKNVLPPFSWEEATPTPLDRPPRRSTPASAPAARSPRSGQQEQELLSMLMSRKG
jgi:hypothetical protein